ncbi:MAG: hypothetical protein CL949_12755 [Erythrobacter sp.]|nr:hypothetical protein [Erythrobacter sp.]
MRGLFTLIAAASTALSAAPAAFFSQSGGQLAEALEPRPTARRRNVIAAQRSLSRRYRNKGAAARPKRHRNMLHVSKRTRRRHRRGKR